MTTIGIPVQLIRIIITCTVPLYNSRDLLKPANRPYRK